jgi:hypothetical protein
MVLNLGDNKAIGVTLVLTKAEKMVLNLGDNKIRSEKMKDILYCHAYIQ